jgi:phosphatidylserine/phosphatidylglycerophosphate/cardiolipin synthase-like enzyme
MTTGREAKLVAQRDPISIASEPRDWFLSAEERGNPSTDIDSGREPDAWTVGNRVEPLIHGADYFARLVSEVKKLGPGDELLLLDWRGDDDELLLPHGPDLGELLVGACRRAVRVRGLLWRSHPQSLGFNQQEQGELARTVNEAEGEVLLDARVRRAGSHHQKLVLLRSRTGDHVGFVGGIDLCYGRRDDAAHKGDPQAERLDAAFGPHPPWHDIQAEVRGPAVADLAASFRERWNDPTPLERRGFRLPRIFARNTAEPTAPDRLPPMEVPSVPVGRHAVQVLRTYPAKRPAYPFAPDGERSIARIYQKVFRRARSLIYVEDQYFWSEEIARLYEETLRSAPELRLIVVVPRHPDRNGKLSGPMSRLGQLMMMDRVRAAAPDRVAFFDLENERGDAIYVHAKTVIVDDVFAMLGSDNMNRRSWTHDSELSIAVLDDAVDERPPHDPAGTGDRARVFARDLRLRLWREHLGPPEDTDLLDPIRGFDLWRASAEALEAWYTNGCRGSRPRGNVRPHRPRAVPAWQRLWARPLYRTVVDPDGRPWRMRRRGEF